jgi:F0F1-type ATP synthase beta subunit
MASLKETVAERIAGLGPEVQTGVADVLVEQVKKKRIDAVLTALNLKDEKEKELKKIKPVQTFNADSTVASETFSKADNDNRKKLTEAITKIEKALNEALGETPNYENLFKVVQNKGAAPAQETPAQE